MDRRASPEQRDLALVILRLDLMTLRLAIARYRDRRTMSYQLQRRNHLAMSAYELREALRGTPGAETISVLTAANGNQIVNMAGKTYEFWPMATNDEISAALANPFIRTGDTNMSITGFQPGAVKAAIDAARQRARDGQAKSMERLAAAGAKAAGVNDAIDQISSQIEREADDALAELAQFTNGGPA
jgi:hypothetical protein